MGNVGHRCLLMLDEGEWRARAMQAATAAAEQSADQGESGADHAALPFDGAGRRKRSRLMISAHGNAGSSPIGAAGAQRRL